MQDFGSGERCFTTLLFLFEASTWTCLNGHFITINLLISPTTEENVERKSQFSICGENDSMPFSTTSYSRHLLEHLGCSLQLDSFCFFYFFSSDFFLTVKRKKWQEAILFKKRKGFKKRRLRLEASTGHHGELPSTWKEKSHSANVNKDKSSWLQLKTGLGVITSQYVFKACVVQAACPQVK